MYTKLDPFPDACSAVLCLNCGGFYCNFCYACFAHRQVHNGKEKTCDYRALAHKHVASHKLLTSADDTADAFLPQDLVLQGQKEHRIQKLIESFLTFFPLLNKADDSEQKEKASDEREDLMHSIMLALVLSYEDLKSLAIDPSNLWFMLLKKLAERNEQDLKKTESKPASNEKGDSKIPVETAGPKNGQPKRADEPSINSNNRSVGGGLQFALAISEGNMMAAMQIIHHYRDKMDVDFLHTFGTVGGPKTLSIVSLCLLFSFNDLAWELFKLGADPLKRAGTDGRSALYVAVEIGNATMLTSILDMHRDLDINTSLTNEASGYNALHVAAR